MERRGDVIRWGNGSRRRKNNGAGKKVVLLWSVFVAVDSVGGLMCHQIQSDFKFNSISSPNQISLRLCFTVCILKCKGQ